MSTTSVCPTCHEARSLSGACGCDVDGHAPGSSPLRRPARWPARVWGAESALLDRPMAPTRPIALRRPVRRAVEATGGCSCGAPTPDGLYLCSTCVDELGADLLAVRDTDRQLHAARTGERGVDYRSLGGGTGGTHTISLPINLHAMRALDRLRKVLRSLVIAAAAAGLDADTGGRPRGPLPSPYDVTAMAGWLLPLVDAMPAHHEFATARRDVETAVEAATSAATPSPHLVRLEPCPTPDCPGDLQAATDDVYAVCRDCGLAVLADPVREGLLTDLRSQALTAAEIAHLCSAYLSTWITGGRDTIRQRIKVWAHRDLLADAYVPDLAKPPGPRRHRFGPVFDRLLVHENHPRHTWDWRADPTDENQEVAVRCLDCGRPPQKRKTRTVRTNPTRQEATR